MALFQKNPFTTTKEKSLYTIGLNKTILIVGLGNIGKSYENTRHNLGFRAVDEFSRYQEFPSWIKKKDLKCELTTKTLGDTRVVLMKPTTMMNLSGEAVQAVAKFYSVEPSSILVIHDDYDVALGTIRTRVGGSSAGHNGIKSIVQHIGENFGRIRIGISSDKPDQQDMADFVLQNLTKSEQRSLPQMYQELNNILTEFVYSSVLNHESRKFIV